MLAVAVVGLSTSIGLAAASQQSPETDLAAVFSAASSMVLQGPAQSSDLIAAANVQVQAKQAPADPTALEQVILRKNSMMAIATSQPYEVRGRNEKAYGVITHWAWQSYAEKQNEFLQRRLDFAREVIAYARSNQPNPQIMELIHWARTTKFAFMNHPEGQDYKDNSIFPFLKDEEFAVLPPAFQK